ncbi:MAG: hypothetical protein WBM83_05765 [Flavobacteriaceae bacterium]
MKRFQRVLHRASLTLITLFLASCYYDEILDEELPEDTVVSFSLDIQPIFTNNCIACHPDLEPAIDLRKGTSYTSIVNGVYIVPDSLDASVLYQRLLGNPSIMPASGSLPSADIKLVQRWIEQGALNN